MLRAQPRPRDGQKVLVRARVGLYEPRGEFQLIVDHIEDAGLGALQRQFEELQPSWRRRACSRPPASGRCPRLPRRIGVITSPTGAAMRDILHVLARRFPAIPVLIYPVPVQGARRRRRSPRRSRWPRGAPTATC